MNVSKTRWHRRAIVAAAAAAAIGAASSSPTARAADWINPAGGSWHLGTNWSTGNVPTSTEWAYFQNDTMTTGTVSFTGNGASQGTTLKNTTGTITFDVGSGNTWTQSLYTIMGDGASPPLQNPSLILQSGTIQTVLLLIGNNSHTEAHVTITGSSSTYNASSGIRVGSDSGSSSTLLIKASGQAISGSTAFVGLQTATNCDLTITDPGSKMTVNAGMQVGGGIDPAVDAGHNTVNITNGGTLEVGQTLVGVGGMFGNAPGNTITLSGPNSKINWTAKTAPSTFSTLAAAIGFNNSDNTLTIDTGAQIVVNQGDVRAGSNAASFNNLIHLASGTITMNGSGVLATSGSGRFDVRRGKFWIENGTATLPGLLANTSTDSLLQLDGGTVIVNNANVSNGSPLLLGNAAGATLTYRMNTNTGTHTFANGVTVQTDGRLEGAATIVGNVTNNGVMATGASAGTLKIVGSLSINTAGGAKTDISNNPMIVTNSPVGSWTGTDYTDISGLIRSGRNGGGWGGPGIITSQSTAMTSNLTTIGVATAAQVKGLTAGSTDTAVWAGQTVTATDTLVLYTYGGDANLDGKLNVDDYGHIDSSIAIGLTGWYNGDFNYDGKINVDDYGIIDFNIGIQGAPFPTGAGAAGVTAVPEPALPMVVLAAAARLARRRRI